MILETCLLSDEEKLRACEVCVAAGAGFVNRRPPVSTAPGATVEDVRAHAHSRRRRRGRKASGGIRDYATACNMIEAGATRLGASSGLKIIEK